MSGWRTEEGSGKYRKASAYFSFNEFSVFTARKRVKSRNFRNNAVKNISSFPCCRASLCRSRDFILYTDLGDCISLSAMAHRLHASLSDQQIAAALSPHDANAASEKPSVLLKPYDDDDATPSLASSTDQDNLDLQKL